MTYLSQRMREIREEEAVPAEVREACREGVKVWFMGREIDPVTAWRIGIWPGPGETVNYMGRGA